MRNRRKQCEVGGGHAGASPVLQAITLTAMRSVISSAVMFERLGANLILASSLVRTDSRWACKRERSGAGVSDLLAAAGAHSYYRDNRHGPAARKDSRVANRCVQRVCPMLCRWWRCSGSYSRRIGVVKCATLEADETRTCSVSRSCTASSSCWRISAAISASLAAMVPIVLAPTQTAAAIPRIRSVFAYAADAVRAFESTSMAILKRSSPWQSHTHMPRRAECPMRHK